MDFSASIYDAWLLVLTCIAAITDARRGTIPNWLTLPTLALAPLVHAVHAGPGALAWSLAGATVCAVVPFAMFQRGAMGGGDVKLFAAAGALAGAQAGLELQVLSYALAAGAAALWLLFRGELGGVLQRTWRLATRCFRRRAAGEAPALQTGVGVRLGLATFAACALLAGQSAMELVP
jgi:prepilin peptidase CpaA